MEWNEVDFNSKDEVAERRTAVLTRKMFTGHSRFRHVFGSPATRDRCYDGIKVTTGSAHDASLCAVNPVFLAVLTESMGGGVFIVLPLSKTGRVDGFAPRVCGHTSPLTDIKWNPFDDYVIASCSDDTTIKLWRIPDGGLQVDLTEWIVELKGHTKRVSHCEWHPSASDILLSTGNDFKCIVWNTRTSTATSVISAHNDFIFSIAWNRDGSLFATTSKDGRIRVIEPRTGDVVAVGDSHEGTGKASKAVFVGDQNRIVTTGFSKTGQRQYALWDAKNLSSPLKLEDFDSSSSILMPFYDYDIRILYLAGKGDGSIRYFEVTSDPPFIRHLSQYESSSPQKDLAWMPKRGVDAQKCEIARFYKLHALKDVCEPVSMIVPRKTEAFQSDIFPPTASSRPALTADQWLNGNNKEPIVEQVTKTFTANHEVIHASKVTKTTDKPKELTAKDTENNLMDAPVTSSTVRSVAQKLNRQSVEQPDDGVPVKKWRTSVEQTSSSHTSSYQTSSSPAEKKLPVQTTSGVNKAEKGQISSTDLPIQPSTERLAALLTKQRNAELVSENPTNASNTVRKPYDETNAETQGTTKVEMLPDKQKPPPVETRQQNMESSRKQVAAPATGSSTLKTVLHRETDDYSGTVERHPYGFLAATSESDDDIRNALLDCISVDAPDDTLVRPSRLRASMNTRRTTADASDRRNDQRGRVVRRVESVKSPARSTSPRRSSQPRSSSLDRRYHADRTPAGTSSAAAVGKTVERSQSLKTKTESTALTNGFSETSRRVAEKNSPPTDGSHTNVKTNRQTTGTPVDHHDLLEKYFEQLEEIRTLKEQVSYKDKKIRRLEDQLLLLRTTGEYHLAAAKTVQLT